MPRFKILPTDFNHGSVVIDIADANSVLSFVSRLQCEEADVLQDETYIFSIRFNPDGLWHIFCRELPDAELEVTSFG